MKPTITNWIVYNLTVCFAVYWLSNLVLWYPWSINETFGQVLMLTINPVLWGYASYTCIKKYSGTNSLKAATLNSLCFITEAIISDFLFFGIIRHAMDKLLHPTTFYGWGFVATLPFIIYLLFRKRISKNKSLLTNANFTKPLAIGLISFIAIVLILVFDIRFR